MPDTNTPTNDQVTKIIRLDSLETYTGYIERKSVPVTREQYTALPSTKLTDGISYFITDEGIIIKNGVSYGASTSSDTTYSLSVGTGDDANKIILTPSSGTPDKVTVPYATTAGSADNATTVNNHTVASDVPADAVFTDNNTTYGLSVGTGDDTNKIVLTPSTGTADKITVPYASNAGTVNGHSVAVDVPSDAEFTDTTYEEATTSTAGLLSSADKTKLNNLGTAAYRDIPTSGDASTSEVVLGTDSRLTDARNAADVYPWAKAENKPTYNASEVGAIAITAKGANGGVAELDSTGKVPSSQLPSYVDDVLEYDSLSDFPLTGEAGKIYIAKDTNKTYRWSGTTYTEISQSLALGETSSTAFRGDHGKTAYDHAIDANKLTTAQSSGLYKIAITSEGHIASVTQVVKSDITGLGIPEQDTNTTYGLSVGSGDDSNKVILTPSTGTPDKITVPYATKAGDAETVNGNNVPVDFEGTTAQWDALTDTQKKSYDRALITDDYDLPDHMEAYEITYNNTSSGLSSTNVQDAIDEVNGKVVTSDATTSTHGLMSASDKSKLNGIAPGATANTGTVTSVGITAAAGSGIGVSGSPITSSGSIALTNNGVRSISGGNARGAIKVNTGGSYSEINLTGVYFGIDEQRDPTEWPTPTIKDTGTIHVYTTTPIQPNWYAGDRLILFLYNQYQNTTDSQQQSYELLLSFNNDSQTTYPVFYMGEDGNMRSVVFDAAKTIKLVPGKAYTLTFTRDLFNGNFFLIDDLFISPTAFIGTTAQWNALDTTGNKTLYDVAYITND